jgi:putative protein kinase ArgK-like GTPase of G3E family
VDAVEAHRDFMGRGGRLSLHRREILMRRLKESVQERLTAALWHDGRRERALAQGVANLLAGQLSFAQLAGSVLPASVIAQLEKGQD